MKVVFLGTSSMLPTKERGHSTAFVSFKNENILVDCGENTQRQLRIAKISPPKITRIFLTHWHGDHIFGLPGFIENLSKGHYDKVLMIYGPSGTKRKFQNLLNAFDLNGKLKINFAEIKKDGIFLDEEDFIAEAASLKHNVKCLAYSITEKPTRKINLRYIKKVGIPKGPILGKLQKGLDVEFKEKKIRAKDATFLKGGKRVTFILDTALNENCYKIAKNSDLLVCESTYSEKLKEKAKDYLHLTSKDAASIAKRSKVKRLILTHFSQRYKDVKEIEEEARKIFPNTICARDFMEVEVK